MCECCIFCYFSSLLTTLCIAMQKGGIKLKEKCSPVLLLRFLQFLDYLTKPAHLSLVPHLNSLSLLVLGFVQGQKNCHQMPYEVYLETQNAPVGQLGIGRTTWNHLLCSPTGGKEYHHGIESTWILHSLPALHHQPLQKVSITLLLGLLSWVPSEYHFLKLLWKRRALYPHCT